MADSKYLNRVALDDDTTIANDPITAGTAGLLTFGKNVGQVCRVVETMLGTGSTLAPAASTYLAGTGAGTSEWTNVSVFPQQHDVVWQFLGTVTSPVTHGTPWRVEQAGTLLSIRLVLGTIAATGAALTVDLLKNGVSVLSTTPSITVGQQINTNAPVFSSTALSADNLLVPKILTGADGVNLQVTLKYRDN
jgi:hypothetical protein